MTWKCFRQNALNSPPCLQRECKNQNIYKVFLGGLIWGTAVIDNNDNVYVGSTNKRFYCISKDGDIKWRYKLKNNSDSLVDSAAAIHPKGFVVIPGGDGYLHAVDMKTGKMIWTKGNEDEVSSKMHMSGEIVNSFEGNVQIDKDGYIYAGCDNDFMYCLNAEGKVFWKYKSDMMIWTCAVVHKDVCYFGCLAFTIYAINRKTGKLIKKYNTGAEIKSSLLCHNDKIYSANVNGDVLCFSEGLDELLWKRETPLKNIYASPVVYKNSIIYISLKGDVCAFDIDDGKLLWSESLSTNVCSSPIIVNENLLIGTSLCKIVAMNPQTGLINGAISLNSSTSKRSINASLSINSIGQLIVGSYDGHVYYLPCDFYKTNSNVSLDYIAEISTSKKNYLQLQSDKHIISIKLVVPDSLNASIAYNSITIIPEIPFDVELSPDGNFINLIPKDWGYLGKTYTVHIHGKYYLQTENWVLDRLKFKTYDFEDTITFKSAKPVDISYFPETMQLHNGYISQPVVLDTYIPAAVDAQGYIGKVMNVNGDAFDLVMIPAIPDIEDEFVMHKDKSSYFMLKCKIFKNVIKAQGDFKFSAMGATIPTKKFVAFLELDEEKNVNVQFYGMAKCADLKGNGKSYKISSNVVNQLCDLFLQMKMVGMLSGKIIKSDKRK